MPAGDKLLNALGGNGENPGRFHVFSGLWHKRRYCYTPYATEDPPPSKRRRFEVMGNSTTRRTSESIAAGVNRVDDARKAGKIKAAVITLSQKEGFKGF